MSDIEPTFLRDAEARARVFKALADPNRVRIVELLAARGEMSGTDIAEATGISLALLSHHGKVLDEADITTSRKEGQSRYWSVNRGTMSCICRDLMRCT
jgi:DNA-binding transcriptional ArsR family regulator